MAAIATAHGTTLEFGTSVWNAEYDLLSYSWTGITRGSYETTYMGTAAGGRTFIASTTYDPGEVTFTCLHDPATSFAITTAIESVEVKVGGLAASKDCQASGFITNVEHSGAADPDGGPPTIEITFKLTGDLGDTV